MLYFFIGLGVSLVLIASALLGIGIYVLWTVAKVEEARDRELDD